MSQKNNSQHIETEVIHAGQAPDPSTGAIMPPIYATSTYVQESPGKHKGYEYSRTKNPTRYAFEVCVALLEKGEAGFAFASGMAAINTILELLGPQDHIIVMDDIYGGSNRLFQKVKMQSPGLKVSFVDLTDLSLLEKAYTDKTRMIWVESPSNPMLKVVDLEKIAAFAKTHQLISVCDNTFASPIIQQPITVGFDIVVHSVTKYLNGHSDMVGGVVVVGENTDISERIGFLQNTIGAILGPFDSYLALRGLKTLAVRMERHSDNAMQLASWLETHPKVNKVYYPGLASHPQHDIAKQQMRYFGGMISVELNTDRTETLAILERFQIFALAESLGGVESLIEHPAIMTHASVPAGEREKLGITDGFIRLSVGIESVDDLQKDIVGALG